MTCRLSHRPCLQGIKTYKGSAISSESLMPVHILLTEHDMTMRTYGPRRAVWSVPANPGAKRKEKSVCCFTCAAAGEPGRGRAHAARRAGRRRTHAALRRRPRWPHGLLLWALLRPNIHAQRWLLLLLRRRLLLWLLLLLLLLVGVHLRHMRRGAAPNNCQRHQHVL